MAPLPEGQSLLWQFEEVKGPEMAEDAPQEIDTSPPSWVSSQRPCIFGTSADYLLQGFWGGTGARQQVPKPPLIKSSGCRPDYGKVHVSSSRNETRPRNAQEL